MAINPSEIDGASASGVRYARSRLTPRGAPVPICGSFSCESSRYGGLDTSALQDRVRRVIVLRVQITALRLSYVQLTALPLRTPQPRLARVNHVDSVMSALRHLHLGQRTCGRRTSPSVQLTALRPSRVQLTALAQSWCNHLYSFFGGSDDCLLDIGHSIAVHVIVTQISKIVLCFNQVGKSRSTFSTVCMAVWRQWPLA